MTFHVKSIWTVKDEMFVLT